MTDDELLREASDPTTPGERLEDIIDEATDMDVIRAAIGNPSLPLPLLSSWLEWMASTSETGHSFRLAAWRNPTTPVLLTCDPRPEYLAAAAQLLRLQSSDTGHHVLHDAQPVTLEALVGGWSSPGHLSERAREVQAFARHLAGLFGLPWPEP